jgi:hypothetical protein
MLVDANLLLDAVDERSPHHTRAHDWLVAVMNGERRVGLPWLSLAAFVRISTNPRASDRPAQARQPTRPANLAPTPTGTSGAPGGGRPG